MTRSSAMPSAACLFERYPGEDEGFLTARRAALVNREALAAMAPRLGLDRYLLLGRGETDAGGATRPSVLAGCFEALAGALSQLSEGTERAEAVLVGLSGRASMPWRHFPVHPSPRSPLRPGVGPLSGHRGVKPSYLVVGTSGPPHDQRFRVTVLVEGAALGVGAGSRRPPARRGAGRPGSVARAPGLRKIPTQPTIS